MMADGRPASLWWTVATLRRPQVPPARGAGEPDGRAVPPHGMTAGLGRGSTTAAEQLCARAGDHCCELVAGKIGQNVRRDPQAAEMPTDAELTKSKRRGKLSSQPGP